MTTIFDSIVSADIEAWIVWESEGHLAFLTPFPNTPGVTIVIPKTNVGGYLFALDDDALHGLLLATKTVARLLERAFDTPRVACVFEGTGVDYVHAKLYPLHGPLASQTDVWSAHLEWHPQYNAYITTTEGPEMDKRELDALRDKIRRAGGRG
jgi:histidine triad (HIT) family protein